MVRGGERAKISTPRAGGAPGLARMQTGEQEKAKTSKVSTSTATKPPTAEERPGASPTTTGGGGATTLKPVVTTGSLVIIVEGL